MYIPRKGATFKENLAFFISSWTFVKLCFFSVLLLIICLIGKLVLEYGMDNGVAHVYFLIVFVMVLGFIASIFNSISDAYEFRKEQKKVFEEYKKTLKGFPDEEIFKISHMIAEDNTRSR